MKYCSSEIQTNILIAIGGITGLWGLYSENSLLAVAGLIISASFSISDIYSRIDELTRRIDEVKAELNRKHLDDMLRL